MSKFNDYFDSTVVKYCPVEFNYLNVSKIAMYPNLINQYQNSIDQWKMTKAEQPLLQT